MLVIGSVLGLVVGVLPRVGCTSAVAILRPTTVIIVRATLIGLGAESPAKAVMMIGFGLLLAAIGFDTITGQPRLTFGQIGLLSGIGFVPVTIGLFGIGEIIASAEEQGIGFVERLSARVGFGDIIETLCEVRKRIWLVISTPSLRFWFGTLPGPVPT